MPNLLTGIAPRPYEPQRETRGSRESAVLAEISAQRHQIPSQMAAFAGAGREEAWCFRW